MNHINSIKNDNRLLNLEWVTHSENIFHGYAFGNIESKLNETDVLKIKLLLKQGLSQKAIAEKFGVSKSVVSNIKIGKTYSDIQLSTPI